MSEKIVRRGNTGVMVVVKILAIVAMVSSAWMLVHIMQETDASGYWWLLNVLMADPIILFVVYLFTGYSKNKNKLLGAYFVVGAAAMMLGGFVVVYQYTQTLMYDLYSTDLWNSYDTYYWVQINGLSLSMNIYALFAIDAFLNFRMVKASRVLSVVSAAIAVVSDLVMREQLAYYDYPDGYWITRWLMPVCLILFYFGAVDGYRPEPKPIYAPPPAYAPVPPPQPMRYAPNPTYAPAPTPTYAPTPAYAPVTESTQPRYCTYCGALTQDGVCSKCGKDERYER